MRFRNPIYNGLGLVRKRPGASLRSPLNIGKGSRRSFYPGSAECPEAGKTISFENCLSCPKYALWNAQDEIRRCWHEFKDLESRGYYDGTWDDHPENFANEPEVFEEIQARKRLNEEFAVNFEREKPELERMAKDLAANSRLSDTYEYYWECEGQDGDGEEDEEEKPARTDQDEDEY